MKYFKITNKQETHHGLHYKTGLNKDPIPFDKHGSCVSGGIYFTDASHLLHYLDYGVYVREVTIPTTAQMVEDPRGNKWRASEVVLGPRKDLRQLKTWEYLVKQGVDLTVNTRAVLEFLRYTGKPGVLRYVLKQCIPLLKTSPYLKNILWDHCIDSHDLGSLKLLPNHELKIYLEEAINRGCSLSIIKHISSRGVKLATRKNLLLAIGAGNLKLVKYLLANGAKLGKNHGDIWEALIFSTEELFKYLIRKGLSTHKVPQAILDECCLENRHLGDYLNPLNKST